MDSMLLTSFWDLLAIKLFHVKRWKNEMSFIPSDKTVILDFVPNPWEGVIKETWEINHGKAEGDTNVG